MDRRANGRWMSLLAGCAMIVAMPLPVARADPPLTADGPRPSPAETRCASSRAAAKGSAPEGMENLVFTGWAVYTCMSDDTVTGKALLFNTLPFNARLGPICG